MTVMCLMRKMGVYRETVTQPLAVLGGIAAAGIGPVFAKRQKRLRNLARSFQHDICLSHACRMTRVGNTPLPPTKPTTTNQAFRNEVALPVTPPSKDAWKQQEEKESKSAAQEEVKQT